MVAPATASPTEETVVPKDLQLIRPAADHLPSGERGHRREPVAFCLLRELAQEAQRLPQLQTPADHA